MAHGAQLESGLFSDSVVTQKELMIQPNAPRFLRQSDELVFSAKVSSLANQSIRGKSTLRLYNALTDEEITRDLIKGNQDLDFALEKGKSTTSKWRLRKFRKLIFRYAIKSRLSPLTSPMAKGVLPVLSNRILVRENKALWVREMSLESLHLRS